MEEKKVIWKGNYTPYKRGNNILPLKSNLIKNGNNISMLKNSNEVDEEKVTN